MPSFCVVRSSVSSSSKRLLLYLFLKSFFLFPSADIFFTVAPPLSENINVVSLWVVCNLIRKI